MHTASSVNKSTSASSTTPGATRRKWVSKGHFFIIKLKKTASRATPSQEQSCKSTFFSEKDVTCIPDPGEEKKLLDTVHSHPGEGYSGHLGVNRTMKNLSKRYYWPCMGKDVCEFCRTCDHCQHMNQVSLQKSKWELHSIPIPSLPWAQIGIDLLQLFPSQGFNYVLTACDYFSKWVELIPLHSKNALKVAKAIYTQLICRYGSHSLHISDQGREFVNQVSKVFASMTGITHRITGAYHLQANSLAERQNRTTVEALKKTISAQEEWLDAIPHLCLSFSGAVNASTGYTPFELMFSWRMKLPAKLLHELVPSQPDGNIPDIEAEAYSAYEALHPDDQHEMLLGALFKIRDELHDSASVNLVIAQACMKKNYDLKYINNAELEEGSVVLQLDMEDRDRKGANSKKLGEGNSISIESLQMAIFSWGVTQMALLGKLQCMLPDWGCIWQGRRTRSKIRTKTLQIPRLSMNKTPSMKNCWGGLKKVASMLMIFGIPWKRSLPKSVGCRPPSSQKLQKANLQVLKKKKQGNEGMRENAAQSPCILFPPYFWLRRLWPERKHASTNQKKES